MWKHEALASAREPHLFQRETEDRVASARNKQQRKKKKGETGRSEFLNLKGYLFILKNGKIGGPDCGSWVVGDGSGDTEEWFRSSDGRHPILKAPVSFSNDHS